MKLISLAREQLSQYKKPQFITMLVTLPAKCNTGDSSSRYFSFFPNMKTVLLLFVAGCKQKRKLCGWSICLVHLVYFFVRPNSN